MRRSGDGAREVGEVQGEGSRVVELNDLLEAAGFDLDGIIDGCLPNAVRSGIDKVLKAGGEQESDATSSLSLCDTHLSLLFLRFRYQNPTERISATSLHPLLRNYLLLQDELRPFLPSAVSRSFRREVADSLDF